MPGSETAGREPAPARTNLALGTDAAPRQIGAELATAPKAETRRRVAANAFYGPVGYASLTALKPA